MRIGETRRPGPNMCVAGGELEEEGPRRPPGVG